MAVMAKIPEHLLKRSSAARAKTAGENTAAEGPLPAVVATSSASTTSSVDVAAQQRPAESSPSRPDPSFVAAAKSRKKINPDREGGAHVTGGRGGAMPAQGATYQGALTEAQILTVVCHERYTLAGADPAGENAAEYEKWCSPDSAIFAGLEDGSITFDNVATEFDGTFVVGTRPRPGHAPDATPGG